MYSAKWLDRPVYFTDSGVRVHHITSCSRAIFVSRNSVCVSEHRNNNLRTVVPIENFDPITCVAGCEWTDKGATGCHGYKCPLPEQRSDHSSVYTGAHLFFPLSFFCSSHEIMENQNN